MADLSLGRPALSRHEAGRVVVAREPVRQRFRAIAHLVHTTHAGLAVGAVVVPAAVLVQFPRPLLLTAVLISAAVISGAAATLLVAGEFSPGHWLVSSFAHPVREALLITLTLLAALVLIVGVESIDRGATGWAAVAVAFSMAWSLRAVAGRSFWSGIARMFAASLVYAVTLLIFSLLLGWQWDATVFVVSALMALGVLGQDSIYTLAVELDDLRTLDAERAVATERKRFAGDLHDIQGQHLGLIMIESELVRRMIAAGDFAGAARHAERVQAIASTALGEMHRVVHAYREVALREELDNAARVLEAARIAVTQEIDEKLTLPRGYDRLLGRTVREAITNLLKHSLASSCTIAITATDDDGRPGISVVICDSGPVVPHPVASNGTGLATLRERYCEHDGKLSFGTTRENGSRLVGWLPDIEER